MRFTGLASQRQGVWGGFLSIFLSLYMGVAAVLRRRVLPVLFAVLVCVGLWAEGEQQKLTEGVIRLHVLANSDSAEDQALKYQVRDAILEDLTQLLTDQESAPEAASLLRTHLDTLTNTATQVVTQAGYSYPVQVRLETLWYPTRYSESAALPAGDYQSLRVILGEGEGHNWWGIVFPALSLPATQNTPQPSDSPTFLHWEDDSTYQFRFRLVELWGKLREGWGA